MIQLKGASNDNLGISRLSHLIETNESAQFSASRTNAPKMSDYVTCFSTTTFRNKSIKNPPHHVTKLDYTTY
jgi:hypothetical protein